MWKTACSADIRPINSYLSMSRKVLYDTAKKIHTEMHIIRNGPPAMTKKLPHFKRENNVF